MNLHYLWWPSCRRVLEMTKLDLLDPFRICDVFYLVPLTLPETNSEFTPENLWLGDYFPFGSRPIFQGIWSFLGG